MANTIEVFANGTSKGTTNADGSGNWSKSIVLSANDYNLKAKATDPAGNTSGFSGLKYIRTGETQTPNLPVLMDDSGTSGDNITNDATPRIKCKLVLDYVDDVKIADNVVKSMVLEGRAGSSSYSAVASKNNADLTITDKPSASEKEWSFTYTSGILANGNHSFRLKWVDQNSTSSSYSSELTITIDTTAPNSPAITSITDGAVIFGTSVSVGGTSS